MYDYNSFYSLFEGMATAFVFILVLVLAFVVVGIIANWKMYKKAGKGGWECIVPVYGYWVLNEIAGLEWWWFLLLIIDVVFKVEIEGLTLAISICSFLASFNCYYNIAKKFGKDKTTSIFAGIFPFIFVLIFGFSKKEVYNASITVSKNGIFGTTENNFTNNTQSTETVDIEDVNRDSVFCRNCGTKLNKDVKFCHHCGKENI